jgi:hypothetical protein
MLRTSILPAIHTLLGMIDFTSNKMALHHISTTYLGENLQGQWIGRRGAVEFSPRSPDLTPLDFYLWGTLKDVVYRTKLATLAVLREEIETACTAIHVDTLVSAAQAVVRRNQKCLDADCNHFEHIL